MKKHPAPNKCPQVSLGEQVTKAISMLALRQRADLNTENHSIFYFSFRQVHGKQLFINKV